MSSQGIREHGDAIAQGLDAISHADYACAVPQPGPTPDPPKPAASSSPVIQQFALAVIGAAVAGIGSLGFVTAVGGMIVEARFRGAGVPSEVSASLESRGYLLAVGGEVLAATVLVAASLVGLVHLWPLFEPGNRWRWRAIEALIDGKAPWSWFSRWRWGWLSRWRCFFMGLLTLSLVDYLVWAEFETGAATQRWILLAMVGVAVVGSATATNLAKLARSERDPRAPRLLAIRLLGLFAVVTLVGGIAAAGGNLSDPKIRPAAVLLLDNPPRVISGIYVSQTSDRVYIAEAVEQKASHDLGNRPRGRLLELPRAHVERLLIGTSQSLGDALHEEKQLCKQVRATVSKAVESNCDVKNPLELGG